MPPVPECMPLRRLTRRSVVESFRTRGRNARAVRKSLRWNSLLAASPINTLKNLRKPSDRQRERPTQNSACLHRKILSAIHRLPLPQHKVRRNPRRHNALPSRLHFSTTSSQTSLAAGITIPDCRITILDFPPLPIAATNSTTVNTRRVALILLLDSEHIPGASRTHAGRAE